MLAYVHHMRNLSQAANKTMCFICPKPMEEKTTPAVVVATIHAVNTSNPSPNRNPADNGEEFELCYIFLEVGLL